MSFGLGVTSSSLLKQEFYPIPVNFYQPGDLIEQDLFFLYQGNYLLYRLKNLIWKKEDRSKLEDFDVKNLFIKQSSHRDYNKFLESQLERILDEQLTPDGEKVEIIYSVSSSLLEELFEDPHSSDKIKRSSKAIRYSIDYLSRNKSHFFDLMKLATASFSEYTHGLHVAAYSVTLARELGFRSFNQLAPVGIGSILHDIGKTKIPKDLIEKEDTLNSSERVLIEKHAEFGYDIVHQSKAIPSLAEMIVLQHHERINGKGYPKHMESDLSIFSQIVGLSDCFDLLTSDRPYKQSMKPLDAIEYLRTVEKGQFHPDLIVRFITMLKK